MKKILTWILIAIIILFVLGLIFGVLKVLIPALVVGAIGVFGYRKWIKKN